MTPPHFCQQLELQTTTKILFLVATTIFSGLLVSSLEGEQWDVSIQCGKHIFRTEPTSGMYQGSCEQASVNVHDVATTMVEDMSVTTFTTIKCVDKSMTFEDVHLWVEEVYYPDTENNVTVWKSYGTNYYNQTTNGVVNQCNIAWRGLGRVCFRYSLVPASGVMYDNSTKTCVMDF